MASYLGKNMPEGSLNGKMVTNVRGNDLPWATSGAGYYNNGGKLYYIREGYAGGSGGRGASGGGGASGGSAGGYSPPGYDAMAAAQALAEQQRALAEQRRQQMDAKRVAGYNAMVEARRKGYDQGASSANQTTDNALQQAYINRQMSERNLDQRLSAMGRSGGVAETTLLGLQNAYGQQRGEHERERAKALSELQLVLDQGILQDKKALEDARANDTAAYYDSLSNIEAQFAQAQMAAAQQQAALMAQNMGNAAGGSWAGAASGSTNATNTSWLDELYKRLMKEEVRRKTQSDGAVWGPAVPQPAAPVRRNVWGPAVPQP